MLDPDVRVRDYRVGDKIEGSRAVFTWLAQFQVWLALLEYMSWRLI